MLTRAIPSSTEPLPVVGLGTYRGFDVAPGDPAYKDLPAVLSALFQKGGTRDRQLADVWSRRTDHR